jgi:hypothetical protein
LGRQQPELSGRNLEPCHRLLEDHASQDKQPDNFDALFGCPHWHEGVGIAAPRERIKFLHDLYQRQLAQAAKFVRSFANEE